MHDEQEILEDALDRAQEAGRWLDEAARGLARARWWGIFDLLGGGWWASSKKHDRMDKVRSQLRRARRALVRLDERCDRLGVIGIEAEGAFETANKRWKRGLDTLLDDPITDVRVQKRIGDLWRQVDHYRRRLERVVAGLEERRG